MTFIGENDDDFTQESFSLNLSDTNLAIGFAVLTLGFFIVGIFFIYLAFSCRELNEWNAIRLILPAVAFSMALENGTLACDQLDSITVSSAWTIVIYMTEAIIAPGLFLATFVITFLAHRTRSTPFCIVYRGHVRDDDDEEGQINQERVNDELTQSIIRPPTLIVMMRLFALGLLVLSWIINFDVVWDDSPLAGRTGWATVFDDSWDAEETLHILLGLLPMGLTSIVCLYFSILLWRYGTFFSMTIYPNIFNPWLSPLVGIICLMVGQCFGPDLFPILSNSGILIYQISLVILLFEVRVDVRSSSTLGNFLDALSDDHVAGTVVPSIGMSKRKGYDLEQGDSDSDEASDDDSDQDETKNARKVSDTKKKPAVAPPAIPVAKKKGDSDVKEQDDSEEESSSEEDESYDDGDDSFSEEDSDGSY